MSFGSMNRRVKLVYKEYAESVEHENAKINGLEGQTGSKKDR
jgi:hypothetical protein